MKLVGRRPDEKNRSRQKFFIPKRSVILNLKRVPKPEKKLAMVTARGSGSVVARVDCLVWPNELLYRYPSDIAYNIESVGINRFGSSWPLPKDLHQSSAPENDPTSVGQLRMLRWLVASNTGTATEAIYGELKRKPKGINKPIITSIGLEPWKEGSKLVDPASSICLTWRLSHACLSISYIQRNCEWLIKTVIIYLVILLHG